MAYGCSASTADSEDAEVHEQENYERNFYLSNLHREYSG